MRKKLIPIIMLSMLLSSAVFAETVPQIVTSTDREVCLDVPAGKYVNGVFMAPVRRICEMFNASCDWYEEERMIIINTEDNITRLFLYPEKDTFRIFTFTGIISGEGVNLDLEAPLEIVNDRTLVPFEQICKALKGECVWSEDKSQVTVNVTEEIADAKRAEIYLSTAAEDVAAGDEIEVTIRARNLNMLEGYAFSGFCAGIIYDKSAFEYVSTVFVDSEGNETQAFNSENPDFSEDSSKAVCLSPVSYNYGDEDVSIGKLVLRALTDEGGEFRLSNRIYTIGQDTVIVYTSVDGYSLGTIERAAQLNINDTPVIIK